MGMIQYHSGYLGRIIDGKQKREYISPFVILLAPCMLVWLTLRAYISNIGFLLLRKHHHTEYFFVFLS